MENLRRKYCGGQQLLVKRTNADGQEETDEEFWRREMATYYRDD